MSTVVQLSGQSANPNSNVNSAKVTENEIVGAIGQALLSSIHRLEGINDILPLNGAEYSRKNVDVADLAKEAAIAASNVAVVKGLLDDLVKIKSAYARAEKRLR